MEAAQTAEVWRSRFVVSGRAHSLKVRGRHPSYIFAPLLQSFEIVPAINSDTPNMHPCLMLDEILRAIARELYSPYLYMNMGVVAMGMTCRAFYEPAMDVLWESFDGLKPLSECFSPDIFEIRAIPPVWSRYSR